MLEYLVYSLFRTVASIYLYFTDSASHWKTLDKKWDKYSRYRIENEGRVRYFTWVDTEEWGLPPDEDIDWHQVIWFSDSILACTLLDTANISCPELDITDKIKEFSHYIYYNSFLTFEDLELVSEGEMKITVILGDLTEKECIINGNNSVKEVLFRENE